MTKIQNHEIDLDFLDHVGGKRIAVPTEDKTPQFSFWEQDQFHERSYHVQPGIATGVIECDWTNVHLVFKRIQDGLTHCEFVFESAKYSPVRFKMTFHRVVKNFHRLIPPYDPDDNSAVYREIGGFHILDPMGRCFFNLMTFEMGPEDAPTLTAFLVGERQLPRVYEGIPMERLESIFAYPRAILATVS